MTKEAATMLVRLRTAKLLKEAAAQGGKDLDSLNLSQEQHLQMIDQAIPGLMAKGAFDDIVSEVDKEALDGGAEGAPSNADIVKFASSEANIGEFAAHAAFNEYARLHKAAAEAAGAEMAAGSKDLSTVVDEKFAAMGNG